MDKKIQKFTVLLQRLILIKCLDFKSRASIYQLKEKGIFDIYLRIINDQNYLFMAAIRGVTLAKDIQKNLTSNNWIQLNDLSSKY